MEAFTARIQKIVQKLFTLAVVIISYDIARCISLDHSQVISGFYVTPTYAYLYAFWEAH